MRPDGLDTSGGTGLAVVRNGRIIDPESGRDETGDLWFRDGRIIDRPADNEAKDAAVIEAGGLLVLPGLVDMHAHLCEPGYEYRENLESGALAAAAGGVTGVACMPDTDPVIDDAPTVRFVRARAAGAAVRIYPIAAVTAGRGGEHLTETGELADAGAVALSDADRSIRNPAILRRALEYSRMFDLPIIVHCEDPSLSAGGLMHEGNHATRLGLKGIPSIAEETVAARDIMLAEWTGGRLHITHVSTAVTVELIRSAKKRGVRVTADVSPHHLVLTDGALSTYDTHLKTNPPLRTRPDVEALRGGLVDGTIDAIASDHTPRSVDEKNTEFQEALPGALGLETMLSVVFTELVAPGRLTLNDAVKVLSTAPAGILGVDGGNLSVGSPADFFLFDPDGTWTVDPASFRSRSGNTPFAGRALNGIVTRTIVDGRVRYRREDPESS